MDTTTLVVDVEGQRPLTRVLLAIEGRASHVLGVHADVGTALVWVRHRPGRRAHLVHAVRRVVGVLAVTSARAPRPGAEVLHHRCHVTSEGLVDVTLALLVDGAVVRAAGDGADLVQATAGALAAAAAQVDYGRPAQVRRIWELPDPARRGRCAVVQTESDTVVAGAPTAAAAVLAALLDSASTSKGLNPKHRRSELQTSDFLPSAGHSLPPPLRHPGRAIPWAGLGGRLDEG